MLPAANCPAPRGRPVDPRKDEQILEAASRLFMANGLQGTTMEQIAKEANVSKLTLYRRYPDKDNLFSDVITSRCQTYVPADLFEFTDNSAEECLTRLGCAMMELATSDVAVNLTRVVMAESRHNPGIASLFFNTGPQLMRQKTQKLMEQLKASGQLNCADTLEAAEMFVALIVGSVMNKRRSFSLCDQPTSGEISDYIGRMVTVFLQGYK